MKWKIRVQGYGTFDFEGSEHEAEEMRLHKARWEGGSAMKWRVEDQSEADKIMAEMAGLFDAGKGVPYALCRRLKAARAALERTL